MLIVRVGEGIGITVGAGDQDEASSHGVLDVCLVGATEVQGKVMSPVGRVCLMGVSAGAEVHGKVMLRLVPVHSLWEEIDKVCLIGVPAGAEVQGKVMLMPLLEGLLQGVPFDGGVP